MLNIPAKTFVLLGLKEKKMIKIEGSWEKGYAFDIHTISSVFTGDNEFGHPTFDTVILGNSGDSILN